MCVRLSFFRLFVCVCVVFLGVCVRALLSLCFVEVYKFVCLQVCLWKSFSIFVCVSV